MARSAAFYQELVSEAKLLIQGENDAIANLANISSLVFHKLNGNEVKIENAEHHDTPATDKEAPKVDRVVTNWVGFYLTRKPNQLVLGPFVGKPACIRINFGRGVCGTCASKKETVLVPDVHNFPGHIACDSASNSEIVLPLLDKNSGEILGVFDLDSPNINEFSEVDKNGLEEIVQLVAEGCEWKGISIPYL